jgi:ABC-type Fe3+-siderophore transport system permease subunit
VSEFLARARPRLTPARLAVILAASAAVAAALVAIAPLLGVDLDRGGWHVSVASIGDALDPRSRIYQIVWAVRVPRVLSAMVVGAALAGAGCAFQAVLRNPLADPFTLGISSGSSLAAVIAIHLGLAGALGGSGLGLAALAGAAVSVVVVWRLGKVGDSLPPATLLLAGVTIAMFSAAGTMMVQYLGDFAEVGTMLHWMMGGLDTAGYPALVRAAPAIGIGLVVLLGLARALNALAAGPEAAASVGVSAGRAQTVAFATSSLLVGASIAIAGPIGFVGLVVPHALRALIGPDHRSLLPASMLVGGALLVACDTVVRLLPAHPPVGVVTALGGGPFFLWILVRSKRGAALWGGGG